MLISSLTVGVGADGHIDAANDAAAAYDLQEYFTMVKEGRVLLPPPMELNVDVGHLYLEGSHLGVSGVENKPVAPPAPKPHIPAPYPEDDGPFGQNPTFLVSRIMETG